MARRRKSTDATTAEPADSTAPPSEPKKTDERVRFWLSEIAAAKKRENGFREEGARVRAIYSGEKKEQTPFNILFSNTETMQPALYSATPRPVVTRRYKVDDRLGSAAAVAAQRVLEFLVDTNIEGYETFDGSMKGATLDGLLPGRGVTAVKYDADVGYVSASTPTPPDAAAAGDAPQASPPQPETGGSDVVAAAPVPPPIPVKTGELVCCDSRSWNRVYFGYARKWSKVPWVAYEDYIDKDEATRLFGATIAAAINYSTSEQDDEGEGKSADEGEKGELKTALVYQIWDKRRKKVCYVSPHYTDDYLKEIDDPLKLTGFFNCPRPLQFVEKTDDMVPVSLYLLYENQAQELNTLTVRINRLVKAIQAKGIYDGTLGGDIENLMDADENSIVPSEKGSSLAAEKGLDNAIWFLPIDKMQAALQQLYIARDACKQVIYEILGIADILRGASKASETLGAQQIKNQWGTLRLKPKQGEVQRYARDVLRMMLEVAAQKFSEDTWAKMTGLPYLTDAQFAQQTAIAQAANAQGQPQALQQLAQAIRWSQVLPLLRDDVQRAYKIDIETNSTLEPDAAEDKKDISEMMTAIGQFLNGVGPLVQQGILPFQAAQAMLLAIAKRFRFGTEIEDYIRAMQPPAPPDNGAADAKNAQQQMQAKEKAMQDAARIAQLETELKNEKQAAALAAREAKIALDEIRLQAERDLFQLEKQQAQDTMKNAAQTETQKIEHKRQIQGLEGKQAKQEQGISKAIDNKMAQSVGALGDMIAKLVNAQGQLLEAVASQAAETQALVKAVRAPRRRVAVRDSKGDIVESRDEVMDGGENSQRVN